MKIYFAAPLFSPKRNGIGFAQLIIGIRTDCCRAGDSEGAVVNAVVEGACDWIVKSAKGLLATISHLF